MFDNLVLYSMQHPATVIAAAVGAIIVLVWMTGSGSRQRFIVFKRTKETEQMARDLSRIATALERLAANRHEPPTDFVGRTIPPGFEQTIAANHALEEEHGAGSTASPRNDSRTAAHPGVARTPNPAPEGPSNPNPISGTADTLGKKKTLDLPNPFFRSK